MTCPDSGEMLGRSIGRQARRAHERADLGKLHLASTILAVLLYEIGTQLTGALTAGAQALAFSDRRRDSDFLQHEPDSLAFWRNATGCVTWAATAAQIVWPLPSSADPQRHERAADLQMLMGKSSDRDSTFKTVKQIRDAASHLDDRLMKQFREYGTESLSSRVWGVIDPTDLPLPFYCWDPHAHVLGCAGTLIDFDELMAEVDLLQQGASAGGFLMILTVDED